MAVNYRFAIEDIFFVVASYRLLTKTTGLKFVGGFAGVKNVAPL